MRLTHIVAVSILLCLAGCQLNHQPQISLIKGKNDPAGYRSLKLENGMQVLLVSDTALTKAYGSVSVRAGYFQDPDTIPGLAHLYEHMLSKGTQKYPDPAEYKQFLAQHGGRSNASTSALRTNYYFQVAGASFEGALERFAWQFIQPIIPQSLVYKERHAVEAEFRMKFKDAYRRKREVWRTAFHPEHPYRKFSTGNLSTLVDQSEISLPQALLDFAKDYYCAPRMSLVMAAPVSLEQLKQMAEKHFSAIPSRCEKTLGQYPSPYANPPNGKLINIRTLRKRSRITLSFVTPDTLQIRRAMVGEYLSWLLEGHNPQGLEQYLKDKGWIKSLFVSQPVLDDKHRLFNLTLRFTAQGWKHQAEALQITRQYLDFIKQQVSEAHFNGTFARLREAEFNQDATHKSAAEIRKLADQLLFYPVPEVLTLAQVATAYDESSMQAWLNALTTANTLLIREHRDLPVEQLEPYYQTPFGLQHQPMLSDRSTEKASFALPDLPRYFAEQSSPASTPKTGCQPLTPAFDSCVLPGRKRRNGYVSINLYLDRDAQASEFAMLNPFYISRLKHQLEALLTEADGAGLEAGLTDTRSGWRISVSGYSGDRVTLFRDILAIVAAPELDDRAASLTLNSYRSQLSQRKHQRLRTQTLQILNSELGLEVTTGDALGYFQDLSEQQYQRFIQGYFERARLTATYFGNISPQERASLDKVFTLFGNNINTPFGTHSAVWDGSAAAGLHHVSLDEEDNAVRLMLMARTKKVTDHATVELLGAMMSAPFFHQLRTQEQLGYSVSVKAYSRYGYPYLGYYVQSALKSPSLLLARIESFNQWFMDYLDNVTVQQFNTVKRSLIEALQQPYTNADSEAGLRRYHFRYGRAENYPHQLQQQILAMSPEAFRGHTLLLLARPFAGVLATGNATQSARAKDQ